MECVCACLCAAPISDVHKIDAKSARTIMAPLTDTTGRHLFLILHPKANPTATTTAAAAAAATDPEIGSGAHANRNVK